MNITTYRINIKISLILTALISASNAHAQSYGNPTIDDVPPIVVPTVTIPPNLFFLLDDSGSMRFTASNHLPQYDHDVVYTVPPNPNDFDPITNSFISLPTPTGTLSLGSGYRQNGLATTTDGAQTPASSASSCTTAQLGTNCYIFAAYYSTKALAMKSSLANALASQSKALAIDLNYFAPDGGSTSAIEPLIIDPTSSSYQTNMSTLLRQIYRERSGGGTPVQSRYDQQYNGIRALATANDENNIFLPLDKYQNGGVASDQLYCRRNYSIVLSDGDYNGGSNSTSDTDGTDDTLVFRDSNGDSISANFRGDGSVPEQRLYAGGSPSLVNGRSSVSDLVLQAWKTDLSTTLPNIVPPTIDVPGPTTITDSNNVDVIIPEVWNRNNNPSDWQNVTTVTIGLKLADAMTDQDLANLTTNPAPTYNWNTGPLLFSDNRRKEDFVRAGYVGRGGYYQADTPDQLQEAFDKIIQNATRPTDSLSSSAITVTSGQITSSSSNLLFNTSFNPSNWSGNLMATWLYSGRRTTPPGETSLPSDGEICFGSTTLPPNTFIGKLCTESAAKWSAKQSVPSWNSRTIFSMKREAGVDEGIAFEASEMLPAQLDIFTAMHDGSPGDLVNSTTNEQIINFIKGSNDAVIISQAEARERDVTNVLGDFNRSSATYLGDPQKHIWGPVADWPTGVTPNSRNIVFVGNNDGMLHAFDVINNTEVFSYIPNALYSKLEHLVLSSAGHSAMVDGQIVIQDILDVQDSDKPKTILVSGLGAGGKGLFALDVTNPDTFGTDNVLWEKDASDDSRIGRIFGKPSIIRIEGKYQGTLGTSLEDNRWVVVTSTGYNTENEDNGVMVFDAVSGELLDFLKLPNAQGLGEIAWVDHQKKEKITDPTPDYFGTTSMWGEVDRGYVADLRGNIWVIDFAYDSDSPSETVLRSAITVDKENTAGTVNDGAHLASLLSTGIDQTSDVPTPLFVATDAAGNPQPITARITVVKHPSGRGYMLYVGTGDFLRADPLVDNGNCTQVDCTNNSTSSANSMYGIWDDIGENFGIVKTKDIEDYNITRDRRFLTYYPWKQVSTTFADSTADAYARMIDTNNSSIVLKTPITWANLTGHDDSSAVQPIDYSAGNKMLASGWITDTGYNTGLSQSERIHQPAFSVINEKQEEGVTFLMHTVSLNASDPCLPSQNLRTWQLSFRTDIIDGPLAPFTSSTTDNNRDGIIDENDEVAVPQGPGPGPGGIVPLGGIPLTGNNINGISGYELGLTPTSGSSQNKDANTCSNGTAHSYKNILSDGTVRETMSCIPYSLASWTEIE